MMVQRDYQTAWSLQHRPFQEFDGLSLLQRAKLDQETFAAYVGAEYVPDHKAWRYRGRKNTARNKLIGILAHILAGMLFPFVHAFNEENEEDKMTARVMRILVEDHLKKANYELKFLYMVTSALVNPAVAIEVTYVTAMQKIKERLSDGSIKITEAVDELLSGLNLTVLPVDELKVADFYTPEIQLQPYIARERRIPYDQAKAIYKGKYKSGDKDAFDFVEAGKTHVITTTSQGQQLFDIDWTEADAGYVQELTMYYRSEDLEVTFVGGVFMGNEQDVYNSNPFKHRRMSLIGNKWISIPIYPFAKSGFEPADPTGRFFYYKSGAFKEYWDDMAQNKMQQLVFDGTYLDVIKPVFFSGVSKIDSQVMVPGAAVGMPQGASVTPYSLGPNLTAASQVMAQQEADMAVSTQDKIMSGVVERGVTAYATAKAEQNARVFLGVFGIMLADLVKQIGALAMDCIIQHTTVGEVDATVPEALRMKYKKIMAKGKEGGKEVTNRVEFKDEMIGRNYTPNEIKAKEWALFDKAGGLDSDQRIYEVDPYKFARHQFSLTVDAEQIISRSMGTDQMRKDRAFAILTHPAVAPFTDPKAVAEAQIEEVSDGDPDRFKRKGDMPDEMMNSIMGQAPQQSPLQQQQPLQVPTPPNPLQ